MVGIIFSLYDPGESFRFAVCYSAQEAVRGMLTAHAMVKYMDGNPVVWDVLQISAI
ncbi:hypothetical protein ACLOJK_011611 [Asimina triloba]